jgi:hypothetical protein
MKTKILLLLAGVLFCAATLSAQSNAFLQKWEQQVKSQRGGAWNTATRNASAPQNKNVYALYVRGKKVAAFGSNSECENERKTLRSIAGSMVSSPQSGGKSHLDNVLSKKLAANQAKTRQEIQSGIDGQCSCRSENNPGYDPNRASSAKPGNEGNSAYGNLAVPKFDNDEILSDPLFGDNPETQYDNIFDAPSARNSQQPNISTTIVLPDVNVNFDDMGEYIGRGIRVGNENWKADWQKQPEFRYDNSTLYSDLHTLPPSKTPLKAKDDFFSGISSEIEKSILYANRVYDVAKDRMDNYQVNKDKIEEEILDLERKLVSNENLIGKYEKYIAVLEYQEHMVVYYNTLATEHGTEQIWAESIRKREDVLKNQYNLDDEQIRELQKEVQTALKEGAFISPPALDVVDNMSQLGDDPDAASTGLETGHSVAVGIIELGYSTARHEMMESLSERRNIRNNNLQKIDYKTQEKLAIDKEYENLKLVFEKYGNDILTSENRANKSMFVNECNEALLRKNRINRR